MVLLQAQRLQSMRSVAKNAILATAAPTYKGATLYQNRAIGQYYSHMTTYAQWATFYNLHLYLRHNMYYTLFHIHAVLFSSKTLHRTVLFRCCMIYKW